jgi:electron transport complex protein RnfG
MAKPHNILSRISLHGELLIKAAILIAAALAAILLFQHLTADRIEHNEHAWLEAQINALIATSTHDNDLLLDRTSIVAPEFFNDETSVTIYRARLKGLPVAAVIQSRTSGYSGPIELLVAVDYDGNTLGVRILSHHETPGIGNAFENSGSRWLQQFDGKSAQKPDPRGWTVRKEGGEFEQFTSATITPRAIIKAVQHTLDFYQHHRDEVFATP